MKVKKNLKISGTMLEKKQLENYLEKEASKHNIMNNSMKNTYPVPVVLENYRIIEKTYNLLNEHLKIGINIHLAGEWLLDNFYIIEETIKQIQKDLTIKKYINFVGLSNNEYFGFARIYVLASEIVAYSDNKIEKDKLVDCLKAYQNKKTLSMDEIWNIGIFIQIAIINNITEICKKIYNSQIERYKAEKIVQKILENNYEIEMKSAKKIDGKTNSKYSFIEYLSYILKRYGKKANAYLNVLEEVADKIGTSTLDIIKKEHFDIAIQKVLMGNCITSIREIQRINFLAIFESINGVEELLKKDPAEVYNKMDYKTKEYYRNSLKEICKKTKLSEMYIAKKILQLSKNEYDKNYLSKKAHIGYYLIDKGINELYEKIGYKRFKLLDEKIKEKIYISFIIFTTLVVSFILTYILSYNLNNYFVYLLLFVLVLIPSSELVTQIVQYILGKIVKPKIIPKIDFTNGIDRENSTMVVVPTILKSKNKVKEMFLNLEKFYLANKSDNLYFVLLGDCSESKNEKEKYDEEVINEGIKTVQILNNKYSNNDFPLFSFIYRKRQWNEKENSYLGWERKRGLLNQFNDFILTKKNQFLVNTLNDNENNYEINNILDSIKYIITLDADTDLIINSAFEMIGAMSHILNKPVIDDKKNIVIDGYGIIQPRVGINLQISNKSLFTKIFAGTGGIDNYTNAISDIYQDNFNEGIFTGKGIYDLKVFSKILKNRIPENKVLSHDLLEGSYLRCGLSSDVIVMDGYPTNYISYIKRMERWIRGDWQIIGWLRKKSPLNKLSKYKIFDNLRRSLFEIFIILNIFFYFFIKIFINNNIINYNYIFYFILLIPFIIQLFNYIFVKKEGEEKQKTFTSQITGLKGILLKTIIVLGCVPYNAYISFKAIIKTQYRLFITHKNLLEWTTSEDVEKSIKSSVFLYYKKMYINVIFGFLICFLTYICNEKFGFLIGLLWIIIPYVMYYLSKNFEDLNPVDKLNKDEKEYFMNLGKKTWKFFKDNLNKENNYLICDNYQEDRKNKIVNRTSSTNIGLSFLAVISAYDLKYIDFKETIKYIENILYTVNELQKWNGHLYNWYDTKTKQPLYPRYVSTVDSGNFVGYLYVLKSWLIENKELINNDEKFNVMYNIVSNMIDSTDFSYLYCKEERIFSIGFNVEENKLTNSFYDLLASEARQASLVAIAKKDVPLKHWESLNRTMTTLGKYKGLVSWSGTSFEYLMPNVNIPKYEGSLLDESCKFMIMSQMQYAKKLKIPWGISESAFNLKDLQSNYQYKAFGIPWLGLKRGLADEMVVTPYGCILAVTDFPKEVYNNLLKLEKYEMINKYGFYESIDFTPERLDKGKKYGVVKTYMAHHQSLILLSINNLFNNKILQNRFMKNQEINAISILLQEKMPETYIITKENKEKVKKIKYKDYNDYYVEEYKKIDERLIRGNVISNGNYVVAMNQRGEGFSLYKDKLINRYKKTSEISQGIIFYFKNIKDKKIWTSNYRCNDGKYKVSFTSDKIEQELIVDNIKTKISTIVAPDEPVEIRQISIQNLGKEKKIIEITSCFEPVLSKKEQDYAHPVFNNLFLIIDFDYDSNSIIVKRKKRMDNDDEFYMAVSLSTDNVQIGDLEYEIDQEKLSGRGSDGVPQAVLNSKPFSKQLGLVTEPIVALKRTVRIMPEEEVNVNFLISVGENKDEVINKVKKYKFEEKIKNTFELSKAKIQAQNRYLRIKGEECLLFQKLLSYLIFSNPFKKINLGNIKKRNYKQSELWKYGISGDLPIIMVKIENTNDLYVVKEIIKAYEFIRNKNFKIDLIILNQENYSYENYLKEEIENLILNNQMGYLKNVSGGIFVLSKNEISSEDLELLDFIADIMLDASDGGIENIIKDKEEEYLDKYKLYENENKTGIDILDLTEDKDILENKTNLMYYNELGAFSEDGKEYIISVNKEKRLPIVWSHILANRKFGTVITENMGGYTWYKNSRLNRITSWSNTPNSDIPSEIIYIKDIDNKRTWSLGLNPMPDDKNYNIIYGFGYAKYIHKSDEIEQELKAYVPNEDSIKIEILKLKNLGVNRKKLKIYCYKKIVMGEDEYKTNGKIDLKYDKKNNIVLFRNLFNSDFSNDIVYVSSSEKIKSYTGNKEFFLGNGTLNNPDGLNKIELNNENSFGNNSCIVYEIEVEIDSFADKEIVFMVGAEESEIDAKNIAYKYSKIQNCNYELDNVKRYWNDLLGKLQVYTPVDSVNIVLNGWCNYQTIQSRLLGRTGYYQSGGAYGFRDQLQDSLGLKYLDTQILENQIIKSSKHQFIEGDVEHWWHDETNRGIRTRFSDDLLWLVYAICEYIEFTGDKSILFKKTQYLEGKILNLEEIERYDEFLNGQEEGELIEHCIKAIDKSLNFGKNGLPKIGSGDWNDGFSNVGVKGEGESVWLGFFIYNILDRFIKILNDIKIDYKKIDINNRINYYTKIMQDLKKSLNKNGWDGRWYKRAFTDDGMVLGSMENDECRIDSIAQSWSVISNAGENDKKYISMESLETHLIDKENGIIKLLDPPFEKGIINPGYIKSYLPGVRENGGQYTHAAIWAIIAETMLGFGNKAFELYKMINPIEHSKTKDSAQKYKVEPYVIAADIYGTGNLVGRGGWTWYTRFKQLVL